MVFPALFPDMIPENDKEVKTLFRNSDIYKLVKFKEGAPADYSAFENLFNTPEFSNVDLVYYFHCVSDWSDQKNMKRTKKGWIATVRNFIRGDVEKNKLHVKNAGNRGNSNLKNAMEYLNDEY